MEVQVLTFDPRYIPDFVRLNRQWIETHFQLEATDLAQLENPQQLILDPGGEVFFVLTEDRVVATCAMIPHGESYELAKMAVDPTFRGHGLGDVLMNSALAWARERGAPKVTLLSNTILAPAISLYRKHGFQTIAEGHHPDYQRCNIQMEISLQAVEQISPR